MIPKVIHYVWVGPKPLPDEDRRRVDEWRRMLPDWEIRAWGNDSVDFTSRYVRQAFSIRAWHRVSDYVRMDALAKHGGVYFDTDVDLIKPLDALLDNDAFVGFQAGDELPNVMVNNAVLAAKKDHWLPTRIRAYFNEHMDGRVDTREFSGPGLLTQTLREAGLQKYSDEPISVDGVRIYPTRYFYPYAFDEEYHPGVVKSDTIAVHRWANSWAYKPTLAKKIRNRLISTLAWSAPPLALAVTRGAVTKS